MNNQKQDQRQKKLQERIQKIDENAQALEKQIQVFSVQEEATEKQIDRIIEEVNKFIAQGKKEFAMNKLKEKKAQLQYYESLQLKKDALQRALIVVSNIKNDIQMNLLFVDFKNITEENGDLYEELADNYAEIREYSDIQEQFNANLQSQYEQEYAESEDVYEEYLNAIKMEEAQKLQQNMNNTNIQKANIPQQYQNQQKSDQFKNLQDTTFEDQILSQLM